MARYVALLRGINLGTNRRVSMQRLRETLEGAGYEGVRTLLQSGNVVLTSAAPPATLQHDLTARLRDAFGFDIGIIVRTRDELAEVIAGDPFGGEVDDPARYQVSFLSAEPDPARVEDLEGTRIAPSASPCARHGLPAGPARGNVSTGS